MTKKTTIPSDATKFTSPVLVEFAAGDDGKTISLNVCDGGVSIHPFWGNLAFDLSGFSVTKAKIPILHEHDTSQRVGFGTAISTDGKVTITGRLLEGNPIADQIRNDSGQGFPFEASMGIDLSRCKYSEVPAGVEREVNGKKIKGPGTVFEKTMIREVSVAPFGALRNTKTEIYALNIDDEDPNMELTIDKMKADFSDLYKQVLEIGRAEADKSGRDALSAIRKLCPDAEMAVAAWENHQTPEQAQIAFLQKECADLKAKAEFAAKNPPPPAAIVNPAKQEFVDGDPTKNLNKDAKPDFDSMSDEQFKKAHTDLAEKDTKVWSGFMCAADYVAFQIAQRCGMIADQRKAG
jgi:hypothetical protein